MAKMDLSARTTIASSGNGAPALYGYFSPDEEAEFTAEGYIDHSMGFKINDQVFVRLAQAPTAPEVEYVVASGTTGLRLMAAAPLPTPTYSVTGADITSGGTGYAVNDVLSVPGGSGDTPATLKVTSVSSGVITGRTITSAGMYASDGSGSAVAVSGGTGSGATFSITMSAN